MLQQLRPKRSLSKSMVLVQPLFLNGGRTTSEKEIQFEQPKSNAKSNFQKLRNNLNKIANPMTTPKLSRSADMKKRRRAKPNFEQVVVEYQLQLSSSSNDSSGSSDGISEIAKIKMKKFRLENKKTGDHTNTQIRENNSENSNLNFIRSLEHNIDNKDIEESFEDGYLNVNVHTQDIFAFMRYEHEIEEMVRKSKTFADNRLLQEQMYQEIEDFEKQSEFIRIEQERRQKEIVAEMVAKEEQKRSLLMRNKTQKVDIIAKKFIDENKHQQKLHLNNQFGKNVHIINRKNN